MKKIDIACIIDDDPIFVFGTKKLMEFADFCKHFLVFSNGKEAFDYLEPIILAGEKNATPELILLDLNMPVMDGWEFLDQFVKIPNHKSITIYIVSSSIDPRDIEKARKYSEVSSYIIKPITQENLQKIMSEE